MEFDGGKSHIQPKPSLYDGGKFKPIQKEIKMSTNRLFVLSVVLALVAIAVFSAHPTVVTSAKSTFSETKDEALRESQLGDRYGELPGYIDGFGPEQIQREYELGERYGATPHRIAGLSAEQIWREYWLGERYGVTP